MGFEEVLRAQRVFEGFKGILKGLKRFRKALKDIGDFEGGLEGFEGVSHDNYPPFKVVVTRRDRGTRRKNGLQARRGFGRRGDGLWHGVRRGVSDESRR